MSQISNKEIEQTLRNSECLISSIEVAAAYERLAAQLNLHYAGLNPIVMVTIVYDGVTLTSVSWVYDVANCHESVLLCHARLFSDHSEPTNLKEDERNLLRKLSEYSDVVKKSTNELMPHHICTYLYELCQEFNRFYEHNKVIGSERETERLALVGQYKTTLGDGLALLGISAPEKM